MYRVSFVTRLLAFFVLLAVFATCIACAGGPSSESLDTGAFLLTCNENVKGFGRLTAVVRSSKPGHCYFRLIQDGLKPAPFGDDMVELTFADDGTVATHTVIENPVPERKQTAVTSTGNVISGYRKFENSNRDLILCDENDDVSILVKDIDKKFGASIPKFHYEPGQELTLLRNKGPQTVYLQQEQRLEGDDKQVDNLIAQGTGFINGIRTYVFVDQSGTVTRFDPETTSFVDDPDLAWLSFVTEVPEFASPGKYQPRMFTFTKDLAVVRRDDKILLRNSAGESFEIERHRSKEDSVSGMLRADSDAMAAGPMGMSIGCAPLPLDDERILIIDINVNKMIVVAPSPSIE